VQKVELDPDGWLLYRTAQDPPPFLRVLPLAPNPSGTGDATTLQWYLRSAAEMQVALYDVRGRRLRSWDLGMQPANGGAEEEEPPASWVLPLTSAEGRLPAGVYWVEARAGGGRAVRKLTLLR
jgi:hypothetical protein